MSNGGIENNENNFIRCCSGNLITFNGNGKYFCGNRGEKQ